jgi:hypothetical protein
MPEQIPDQRAAISSMHMMMTAAGAVHSSSAPIIGYANATPSKF